jgi:hypothetical protein
MPAGASPIVETTGQPVTVHSLGAMTDALPLDLNQGSSQDGYRGSCPVILPGRVDGMKEAGNDE